MAAVRVNRGMPRPESPASTLPRDEWESLLIVRRYWVRSQLPFDCRLLRQVAADAPLMAPELGYDSTEAFLRQELELDPDLVNRVVGWLEQEQPTEAVPLALAAAAAQAQPQPTLGTNQHSEGGCDQITPSGRGTSQVYLLRRLARDAPEILERIKAGEFKSARAAAIEAGIIKPAPTVRLVDDPVKVAAAIKRHLTRDQLVELVEALMA